MKRFSPLLQLLVGLGGIVTGGSRAIPGSHHRPVRSGFSKTPRPPLKPANWHLIGGPTHPVSTVQKIAAAPDRKTIERLLARLAEVVPAESKTMRRARHAAARRLGFLVEAAPETRPS